MQQAYGHRGPGFAPAAGGGQGKGYGSVAGRTVPGTGGTESGGYDPVGRGTEGAMAAVADLLGQLLPLLRQLQAIPGPARGPERYGLTADVEVIDIDLSDPIVPAHATVPVESGTRAVLTVSNGASIAEMAMDVTGVMR